ncbi:ribose-phosphate pyrophosphokinase [Sphaerisporangium rufum]|uniref:ribose-phosphate diphosphokinase n=1 Tax=Sphaerisporangium rufum TaxID=1381558 RepID=A0A919QYY5_9ACTN|nr:ribose-phosphate pyrophosphokinase [Sphaerisporangium rufum]GII76686.1 ribose-phosphate pyrophosphokinase [Sphaerisporangium rufum]
MTLRIVAGTAARALAGRVAAALGAGPAEPAVRRFPDGELRPAVGGVRGADVYVLQSTGPPVNEHVVELLLLLDACRRAGAGRITAVVPYFGYARQDRRTRPGEAIGSQVVAGALAGAGAQRLVVVDPHTPGLEAACPVPTEMITAVPVLAAALGERLPGDAVVVAPDLGAVKLAEHYATSLGRPVAVVRKTRLTGTSVVAEELVGDVRDRPAVMVDDMISTGGTIEAAVNVLRSYGARPGVVVAAVHGVFAGPAAGRLAGCALGGLLVTDSVAQMDVASSGITSSGAAPIGGPPPAEVLSIAPLLADAIGRLHGDRPLDDLLMRA